MKIAKFLLILLFPLTAFAEDNVLNVYAWTGELPDSIVRKFEKETGINVNFSTYGNNEIMYAKIRASKNAGYDVIMPSSYFVDRMARQGLLEKLDKSKITNLSNLNPAFMHPDYDRDLNYSIPAIFGITGIFYNNQYFNTDSIKKWSDLWEPRFTNKLLMLDDMREVFSMALISLGYSPNDADPEHIKAAFLKLQDLSKNIKLFSSETVISIMIDEDATVGMSWNGDEFKARRENKHIRFIFPQDGFIVWVDNYSILKNAKHKEAAYKFLNFILRADIAKEIAEITSFPTPNAAALKLLPEELRNDQTVYPSKEIMKRAIFQTDPGDKALELYAKYWEELKMGG